MAQHAVLMNARFVREGVAAHDCLVALHRHADQALQQLRGRHDTRRIDRRIDVVEGTAHLQRHGDFFQRAIARALTDAIDGAFHLARTAFDGRQRVGHRQAQIVVAVRAEDDLVGTFHAGDQAREHATDFFRRGEADRVGQIDRGGAGGDRHAGDLGQEIFFGAGCILGRKFHIVDIAARQRHVSVHRFQHLLAAHAQLVLAVQRAGGQEHMQARVCGCLQRLGRGFDIGLQAARQHRQGGAAQFPAHHRHRFAVECELAGKPVSMMSTPSSSSARAMTSFCWGVMLQPGIARRRAGWCRKFGYAGSGWIRSCSPGRLLYGDGGDRR